MSVEDRNIAFSRRYVASMKNKKVAEEVSPPPPPEEIDMSEYLEEASKSDDDGSEILKKLGLLSEDKKGNAKYQFL